MHAGDDMPESRRSIIVPGWCSTAHTHTHMRTPLARF